MNSRKTISLGVLAISALGSVAKAQQNDCLILDAHCVELREYLAGQPADATIGSTRDRLGDILVANYFPSWPKTDEMKCVEIGRLPELLSGKSFEVKTSEFAYPLSVTPSLIEYVMQDGTRFCHFDRGAT